MDPNHVYQEGEAAPGGIQIENTLNRADDSLPFGFFNPDTEGKLTWICNYGPDNDIISVFCMDHGDHSDRDVKMLKDLEEAKYFREQLIKNGWRKLIPPKIQFTVSGEDGKKKPMTRKERRYLDRRIRQVGRQQARLQTNLDETAEHSDDPEPGDEI